MKLYINSMVNGKWIMENEHSEPGHLKSGGVENEKN